MALGMGITSSFKKKAELPFFPFKSASSFWSTSFMTSLHYPAHRGSTQVTSISRSAHHAHAVAQAQVAAGRTCRARWSPHIDIDLMLLQKISERPLKGSFSMHNNALRNIENEKSLYKCNQPCLDMQLSHSATSNTSVTMAPPIGVEDGDSTNPATDTASPPLIHLGKRGFPPQPKPNGRPPGVEIRWGRKGGHMLRSKFDAHMVWKYAQKRRCWYVLMQCSFEALEQSH